MTAPQPPPRPFAFRGICYDAGTLYEKDWNSRPSWRAADVEHDLRAIRDDLHCDAVSVVASDTGRLARTGEIARGLGLFTWLQPRPFDLPEPGLLEAVGRAARAARRLHDEYGGGVGLNLGCEISLSMTGIVPGRTFGRRSRNLVWSGWLLPWFNARLRGVLDRAVDVARRDFAGPLTYGAGMWERVDWTRFDYVGLDAYPDATNHWRLADDLRAVVARGKPVLALEVGCCAYRGAAEKGATGFDILTGDPRRPVRGRPVRDESVQAGYLERAFDLFEAVGTHGVFVWAFSEPGLPHVADPAHDTDMGSFGVVAVLPGEDPDEPERWRPKLAFDTVARRYAAHRDAARAHAEGAPDERR
ncbi:hypothetical protein HNP84_003132 [Thermocatellispora tengchongensis]|uniref:Abortive infection protein n=1 Tax=Thermocatellispora tengchongensis TaxID=1073253 RepID=A0A840P4H8_9ACTN|nr:hypothetical protein [Thermocatellispora tengchongensis]MBB5133406.1 hypothetical protein [Thermocatellispora tengchongensis]